MNKLTLEELAVVSDTALDAAYHYGRCKQGSNFGWLSNVESARAAKRMIEDGITDIEVIAAAIHEGWNITAMADYEGRLLLETATPQEKKEKRFQLAQKTYSMLTEEDKEKDRVVARALLKALL